MINFKKFKSYIGEIKKFQREQQQAAIGLNTFAEVNAVTLGDSFFESYVKLLEELTGDTGWVSWYVFERGCGEKSDYYTAHDFAYCSPDKTSPDKLKDVYKKIEKENKQVCVCVCRSDICTC